MFSLVCANSILSDPFVRVSLGSFDLSECSEYLTKKFHQKRWKQYQGNQQGCFYLQVEFELVLVMSFSRLSVSFTTPFLAAFDIKSITSEWDNPVTGLSSTAIRISPRCIIPFSCAAPPIQICYMLC